MEEEAEVGVVGVLIFTVPLAVQTETEWQVDRNPSLNFKGKKKKEFQGSVLAETLTWSWCMTDV